MMDFLFILPIIIANLFIFYVGYKTVTSKMSERSAVERIANLQHWEYMRSLEQDAYKSWRSKKD